MSDPTFVQVAIPPTPPSLQDQDRVFRFNYEDMERRYVGQFPNPPRQYVIPRYRPATTFDQEIDQIREEVARVDPVPLRITVIGTDGMRGVPGTAYATAEPSRIQGSAMLDKVYEAVAAFTRKWGHAPHYLILSENLFGALRTDPCVRGYIGPPVIQGTSNGDTQILGIETVIVPPPFGPVEVICGRRP